MAIYPEDGWGRGVGVGGHNLLSLGGQHDDKGVWATDDEAAGNEKCAVWKLSWVR